MLTVCQNSCSILLAQSKKGFSRTNRKKGHDPPYCGGLLAGVVMQDIIIGLGTYDQNLKNLPKMEER